MSASDIILARRALRQAANLVRQAQSSAAGRRDYALRDAMERRAASIEALVELLNDDLNHNDGDGVMA